MNIADVVSLVHFLIAAYYMLPVFDDDDVAANRAIAHILFAIFWQLLMIVDLLPV